MTEGLREATPTGRSAESSVDPRLRGMVRRTPMLTVVDGPAAEVALKLENHQIAGSFKIRGAMNRILADADRHHRVVAASGGNHGVAVAATGESLALDVDVFVPAFSPAEKARRIESFGATVHRIEGSFTEVERRCREFAAMHDALFVHPFDDPAVIAGQGTAGLEIIEQNPGLRSVFVAVGGGGLAAGLAGVLPPEVELVAVEPEACPTLGSALAAGRPVTVEVGGLAADSLGAPMLGSLAYASLQPRVREVQFVTEDEIAAAQDRLWDLARLAVEPAAACAYAGYLRRGDTRPGQVVLICGGNVERFPRGMTT